MPTSEDAAAAEVIALAAVPARPRRMGAALALRSQICGRGRVRIAFYAPLKPPDHPVPSGDRRIAELFLRALRQAGHQPFVGLTIAQL